MDVLMGTNIQPSTSFLLDALKDNPSEQGHVKLADRILIEIRLELPLLYL